MPVNNLGRHIVVELYDCEPELLNNVEHIEKAMVDAARDANATVINTSFHHFSPFGVSGVVVIQESHLAIHTWPEYGYAAVDVFTCGETVNPWTCYKALMAALKADHGSAVEMGRGQRELLERRSIKAKGFEQPTQKAGVVDATMGETTGKVTGPSVERNIWFTERDEEIALSMRHRGDVLFRDQSPFQKVEVYDTYAYGKMLTLDGLVMTTEKDEYVYHEMITHPALFTHPGVKRALIIGGGDGGAVRELVRHSGIEKVVMVEIDGMVIEASKKHLPGIASAFDHPKLELRVDDGIKYVTECESDAFDLVIIDSTDPVGPAKGLFTHDFYRHVHRLLRKEGVMLAQSQSPRYNVGVFQEIFQCYRDIFGKDQVHTYLIQVPTYPSGTWAMAYASKGTVHPIQSFRSKEAEEFALRHKLKYYNEAIHTGSFALPGFVRELLGR